MRKIILVISFLFVQGAFSQITLTPFIPNISSTFFTGSLDAFDNEIVVSAYYGHDLTQRRVFVFEKNGSAINQETYFTPADMALNDNFGESVSIDNDFIAASSRLNDQVASNAGAVYMYRKVANTWQFFQKITPFDGAADDYFGTEVTVVGNQLFVGSANDEATGQPGTSDNGAVYVYHFNGTTWDFSQKITQSGTSHFGSQIKIESNKMVISGGNLYTYEYDGTNWNYSSTTPGGIDFDLDNNQLFILSASDQLSIYDAGSTSWILNTTLTSLNYYDTHTTNFKVKGNIMFISLNFHALLYTARTPTAVYRKMNGTWTYQEMIYGEGPSNRDDAFGSRIAISDDIVVIGAPAEYLPSADGGKAYTFDVALGIDQSILNKMTVYPNPTTDKIYLSQNSDDITLIDVYQYDGKLVKSIKSNFDSMSLSELQSGIYLLKLTMNNGSSATRKIVKI
jgi:hypothetical protein